MFSYARHLELHSSASRELNARIGLLGSILLLDIIDRKLSQVRLPQLSQGIRLAGAALILVRSPLGSC